MPGIQAKKRTDLEVVNRRTSTGGTGRESYITQKDYAQMKEAEKEVSGGWRWALRGVIVEADTVQTQKGSGNGNSMRVRG